MIPVISLDKKMAESKHTQTINEQLIAVAKNPHLSPVSALLPEVDNALYRLATSVDVTEDEKNAVKSMLFVLYTTFGEERFAKLHENRLRPIVKPVCIPRFTPSTQNRD